MKLAMFDAGAGPRVGVVIGETIVDSGIAASMIDLITDWDRVAPEIAANVHAGRPVPLSEVRLLAPIARPGKIFAIGLNYADHIAESHMETPPHQLWFSKAVTSVTGPFDPVLIARNAPYVDYEVELVAIIGKRGKYISKADAASYIFGYCVGNDVTERMWQHRTAQWTLGKSFDTHAPIGPWITTADEIPDPHHLDIRCEVNGKSRQNSNTKHLVFDIFDQIEHLSHAMTLEPGDLIFTGTPGGIGAAMEPKQFLQPGDIVRCEIQGLGHIENTLAAEE
jgi:2-keto-4-pentenoate hydratase/2-oxohepta-3-ene-1,7-dioic acid hydratase in catechol pathway